MIIPLQLSHNGNPIQEEPLEITTPVSLIKDDIAYSALGNKGIGIAEIQGNQIVKTNQIQEDSILPFQHAYYLENEAVLLQTIHWDHSQDANHDMTFTIVQAGKDNSLIKKSEFHVPDAIDIESLPYDNSVVGIFTTDGMQLWNLSNLNTPKHVGSIDEINRDLSFIHNHYVYTLSNEDYHDINIYDIQTPEEPLLVNTKSYRSEVGRDRFFVVEDVLYHIPNTEDQLFIYEFGVDGDFEQIKQVPIQFYVHDRLVIENKILLFIGINSAELVDVRNPRQPEYIKTYQSPYSFIKSIVAMNNGRLWIGHQAGGSPGTVLSNPYQYVDVLTIFPDFSLDKKGEFSVNLGASDIFFLDDIAYIEDGFGILKFKLNENTSVEDWIQR